MPSVLTKIQMEKLTTKRLLSYLKKLQYYKYNNPHAEINENDFYDKTFKKCYDECKEILNKREHINKGEFWYEYVN